MAEAIKVLRKRGAINREINQSVKSVMQLILDLREQKAAAKRLLISSIESVSEAVTNSDEALAAA